MDICQNYKIYRLFNYQLKHADSKYWVKYYISDFFPSKKQYLD